MMPVAIAFDTDFFFDAYLGLSASLIYSVLKMVRTPLRGDNLVTDPPVVAVKAGQG